MSGLGYNMDFSGGFTLSGTSFSSNGMNMAAGADMASVSGISSIAGFGSNNIGHGVNAAAPMTEALGVA